jgi:hypothetical protein
MTTQIKPSRVRSIGPREAAFMLIGAKWFRCEVERIDDIPHWSGNTIRRFTCRFPNGDVICCGRNSIRTAKGRSDDDRQDH